MKEFGVGDIRNIGLAGNNGSGKTMLGESFIYTAGVNNRLGNTLDGSSILDFQEEEIKRKISISLSLAHFEWKNCKINIVDSPGYLDFIGEVISMLEAVDNIIIVVDSTTKLEVGTYRAWDLARERNLPVAFFINFLDRERAEFKTIVNSIKEELSDRAIPFAIPLGLGQDFKGVCDVLSKKSFFMNPDKTSEKESQTPDDIKSEIEKTYEQLLESSVEIDDRLVNKYLEGQEISNKELLEAIKKSFISRNLFPIFCGSAGHNTGTQILLNSITSFFASPLDSPTKKAFLTKNFDKEIELKPDKNAQLCGRVFKTISEAHMGELSIVRIYSGFLSPGMEVLNSSTEQFERIGQIYTLNGKIRNEINQLIPGDIGALVKLKNTHTGNTICDPQNYLILSPIPYYEAVAFAGIKALKKGEEDKIGTGLSKIKEEDPTIDYKTDPDIKQTVLSGMGELQLEIVVSKLKERFGVDVEIEKPKIPYRETITKTVEAQGKYKRQTGGRGQFGDCYIRFEPLPRGAGFEFVDAIVGGVIPNRFIPSVEKGLKDAMEKGILAGFKTVDIKATLYDGSHHPVDSSDIAFKIAASMAFKKAMEMGNPVLLEPIYELTITVPEEFLGDIMGDLSGRRGKILGMEAKGKMQIVKALAPLAELYKYSADLRSMTQGKAFHTRKFSHYDQVPKEIAEKIIAEHKPDKEKEE